MLKKMNIVMMIVLLLVSTQASVFASDSVKESVTKIENIQTKETHFRESEYESRLNVPNLIPYKNNDEFLDYVESGDKNFSYGEESIDIEYLLKNSDIIYTKSGNVTGTYSSSRLNTGTPGIKWSYKVYYELEPLAGGIGWKFVTSNTYATLDTHKTIFLYTWAQSCLNTWVRTNHSFSSNKEVMYLDVGQELKIIDKGGVSSTYTEYYTASTNANGY